MKVPRRNKKQKLSLRLAECAMGRALLHVMALARSRRNVRWHIRGIARQFSRN